jgi:hypothetical protein
MNIDEYLRSLFEQTAQHSVHPTGGTLRVFRQFAWLGVGSGKVAFSRPAHQRVMYTVRRLIQHHSLDRSVITPIANRARVDLE